MHNELKNLEMQAADFQSKLVVVRSQKNQIAGELVDQSELESSKNITDWAYIDLIISRYRTPKKATLSLFKKRDAAAQRRFQTNVLNAYKAKDKDKDRVWCCVTGKWLWDFRVTAAHIVPYNIGENNATYLFGEATHRDGHLMSPANGLPMYW